MKKHLLVFIVIIISLTSIILFVPRSAVSSTEMLKLDAQDIKEVVYKVTQKTVSLELQREINGTTILNFRNFNKLEALMLMDMLTSKKGIAIKVDPDSGYIYDFGFSVRLQ